VIWFPLALCTAFATATGDALLKARFAHLSPMGMALVRFTSPVPFLAPLLLLIPWPRTDLVFWQTVGALVPLEVLALILYMQALRVSPLSLSIPFLAFTPAFILVTGWVVLGERVTGTGLSGILLTVAGAYILHFNWKKRGLLTPLRSIAGEPGSKLMLMVAAIYSLTSVLGKQAILHSNPVFFGSFYFVLLGLITPPFLFALSRFGFWKTEYSRLAVRGHGSRAWKAWWAVGLTQAVMVMCHMWAIHLATAAYMIAVKRTSLLFSVVYGHLVFDEADFMQRLGGAGLMLAGVGLIVLAG
jgi:drug/metabolite transporter (DMT)-like permease